MANETCLSFVSGKGGVGKTMLAANVAWQCSRVSKTLLVDLDFHNQGASGLMAPHFDLDGADAFTTIRSNPDAQKQHFVPLTDTLFFMPAVSWTSRPSTEQVTIEVHSGRFRGAMQQAWWHLYSQHEFQIIVLDCHGGLDPVSYSARRLSDVTFMVTEADSVTFAGTLELLRFYEEENTSDAKIGESQSSSKAQQNVRFIVNRILSKFNFTGLDRLYRPYFAGQFGSLCSDRTVFCYIPSEELLSESFGEYPFHVEIAPGSVYTKKVRFICYHTLSGKFNLSKVVDLAEYESIGRSKRVRRQVTSQEQKNVAAVMNFYACASIMVVALSITVVGTVLLEPVYGFRTERIGGNIFLAILVLAGAPTIWFFSKALIGIMLYFRRRHLYQKRLFKALRRQMSVWQWLALIRSFVLRWSTTVGIVNIGLGIVSLPFL